MSGDLWTPETAWDAVEPFLVVGVLDMARRAERSLRGIYANDEFWARRWLDDVDLMRTRMKSGAEEYDCAYFRKPPHAAVLDGEQAQEYADGVLYGAMRARLCGATYGA